MFNFTGYKCPVCGKPFAEGDDIVVCPDCGAPHHRECYQRDGRCSFESLHGPHFEWQPSQAEQEAARAAKTIVCPSCGAQCPGNSRFCLACGAALAEQGTPRQDGASGQSGYSYGQGGRPRLQTASDAYRAAFGSASLDDIPIPDWENFLGRSSALYLTVFGRMKQTGRRFALNISALLLGPIYFFYRKMWKWALVFSAIFFALNAPSLLLMLQITGSPLAAGLNPDTLYTAVSMSSYLSWGVMLVRGFYAHYLYRRQAAQKIRQISESLPQGEGRAEALRQSGGVSLKGVVLFVLVVLIVNGFVASHLGPNVAALYSLLGLSA